jgi:hypothetical protein
VQLGAPAAEYDPAAHEAHAVDKETPVAVRYFPALQFKQDDWPVLDWYVPEAQLVQDVDDAAAAYVPAPHAVHGLLPVNEYWPATHWDDTTSTLRSVAMKRNEKNG